MQRTEPVAAGFQENSGNTENREQLQLVSTKNKRTVAPQKTRVRGRQEVLSSSLEIVSQLGPRRCFPFPLLEVDACLAGIHLRSSPIVTSDHDGLL